MISKHIRELISALNAEGISVSNIGRTRRHYALRIEQAGKQGRIIVSMSPSDNRFIANVIRDAKRAVRA